MEILYNLEFLLICLFIFFQSIFGIGLLIFGTPTFLFLDYSFSETLSFLLPISVSISAYQTFFSKEQIPNFKKNFFIFCLPCLILFLIFTLYFLKTENIKIFISVVMILISILNLFDFKKNIVRNLIKLNDKIFYMIIGAIHGMTNLGGGFLSFLSSSLYFENKEKIRKTIAFGYLFLGVAQISILIITNNFLFETKILLYSILSYVFFLIGKIIFNKLDYKIFNKILYIVILIYGVLILMINLNNFILK